MPTWYCQKETKENSEDYKRDGATVKFTGLPSAVAIDENQKAGFVVYTFSVANTLAPGFPYIVNSNPLTKAFRIDPTATTGTYTVVVSGNPVLDYETEPNSFDLQIFAEDTTGATNLQILTVQLKNVNEAPFFLDNMATQSVTIYITEKAPAGVIYKIHAQDPEDPPDKLKYSLTSTPAAPFSVSPPGSISSNKIFDYETDPHTYSLTIKVEDPQGMSVSGIVIININNINDENPYFTVTNTVHRIREEVNPGTVAANVTAKDPDVDDFISSLFYTIDTPSQYFTINQLTGVIQVAMRIDREVEPFRQHPNITLEIVVRDRLSSRQPDKILLTFVIEDINDNPPVCNRYAFSIGVPENESKGSLILDLAVSGACKDVDVERQNNEFNFTGLSGLGSNSRFTLDPPASGKIVIVGDLDYEDPNNIAVGHEYSLTVLIQNIASPYFKQNIYVYIKILPVDEYPPVFNRTSYEFNVSELAPAKTSIGQVYATDQDYPFTGITYSIVFGSGTLQSSNIFWIDPNTGNLQLAKSADYETQPKHTLTVQAVDSNSKVATVLVTVNVIEANDEKPICNPNAYSLSVPVDQGVGTNIQNFKLTCTDRDSEPRSFRYFINSGNINNQFTFSPNAGSNVTSLTLASAFDYPGGSNVIWDYQLLVYITDDNILAPKSAGLVQTGTVTLNIHVYIPGLTTQITTTTPAITYLIKRENVYSASIWYVPFLITLGSCLLLGCLAYLTYLLAKCIRCPPRATPEKAPLSENIGKKKDKAEIMWEMTQLNTVFDGEAIDPITGKIYEYNSKSGARRWKDTKQSIGPANMASTVEVFPSFPGTKEVPRPLEGGPETVRLSTPRPQKSREGRRSPVKSYENDSKSGARGLKDTKESIDPASTEPTVHAFPSSPANAIEGKEKVGTPNKKENSTDEKAVKAAGKEDAQGL
ncbi:cadherin-related family member 3 isoform X2 [Rhinatrema bivittatum]|uniref:cadherin-related family member 3 isoform X2 n=1 Tax=Rhinatrema bivittatum TaxID=194408 RepID=UPI00112D7D9C|nr:cadherin-related family member 3 isoform X2 [Rhinatrema bivittatum]